MRLMQKQSSLMRRREQGVALLTIIIFVLLTMLMALWASRTAIFNEMLVGNDADYQRAYEAAQALVQDAELDIRGERANGTACTPPASAPADPTGRSGVICRDGASITKFPLEETEVGPLLATLGNVSGVQCKDSICAKQTGKLDFWNNADAQLGVTLKQMTVSGIGARYGEYTGALKGATSNPILTETSDDLGGWYWIEIMPYDPAAGNSGLISNGSTNLALNLKPNVAYRITALAYGRKLPESRSKVVLQQTYVRQVTKD